MLFVCGGELSDAVVAESEGEAGVYDVAEAGGCFGGPVPEGFGHFGFVVAEFPGGIGPERIAEDGGFAGGFRLFENGGVAELHIEFQEDEAAEQEALFAGGLIFKEAPGGFVIRRSWIGGVEEKIGIGGENHDALRSRMASASARRVAGSARKSPPQSSVGKRQTAFG